MTIRAFIVGSNACSERFREKPLEYLVAFLP
jgi:hypothetical protein